jgi:RNA polymerase sigma-70 factor (ECF subfamily)
MGTVDSELMQRWQAGDIAAFEALVRRWQQPVARILFRLVNQAESVADLSQEVFLRVFHARGRYRENGAFAGWLYRIALNVARDAARRRRPGLVPLADVEATDRIAPAETVYQQQEIGRLVTQALAELPEAQRVVLVLRHYEGLAFEEIARLLDTPASTLKSRLAAALNRLRVRLQELGCGPEDAES